MRAVLLLLTLALAGCAGTIDRCADGLNPPPLGGWDSHGPG